MIPKQENLRHESNLTSEVHQYTVTMTPTLAKILSSQVYTDKILAAIREPLSNAYDTHVRAKTDAKAELHLPTMLEPWFALRDYGTGLDHSDVIRLFFSYNVSDKRDSNEEIGGLGVGAKAFYAYTDICTITSYHNGTVRRYAATKGQGGLPQGQLIDEAPTDQPNGIEIRYPVNRLDFDAFKTKTEEVLKYLKLAYVSNIELNIKQPKVFYSTDIRGYRMELIYGSETRVIMGGIAYKIPEDILWHHANKRHDKYLNDIRCHIHVPIGGLEISASRESLSPTEEDKDLICDLVFEFQNHVRAQDWDVRVEAANNWIEACRMREFVAGVLGSNLHWDKDGNRINPENVLRWRGMPTYGMFRVNDTYPIARVYDIGRRSARYRVSAWQSSNLHTEPTRVFWMPKDKKIAWKRWYMDYRSMRGQEFDLFITAATFEEAQELAVLAGIERPVEDGNTIHTKATRKKATSKASEPSPFKGMAWVSDYGPRNLDDFEGYPLVLTNSENHTTAVQEAANYNKLDVLEKPILPFRPYGVAEKAAMARFPDVPRTVDEWVDQNKDKFDKDAIISCMKRHDIFTAWKDDWMYVNRINCLPKCLGFPVKDINYLYIPDKLKELVDYPGIDAEMEAIQKWHETVLPTLPEEVKGAAEYKHQFSYNDIFNLFSKMYTTLEA